MRGVGGGRGMGSAQRKQYQTSDDVPTRGSVPQLHIQSLLNKDILIVASLLRFAADVLLLRVAPSGFLQCIATPQFLIFPFILFFR